MMNKKTLTITIFIILALSFGAYFFMFQNEKDSDTVAPPTPGLPSLPGEMGSDGEGLENPNEEERESDSSFSPGESRYKELRKNSVAFSVYSTATSSHVYYMERDTGHVYMQEIGGNIERISNTTVPRIQKAQITSTEAPDTYIVMSYFNEDLTTLRTFLATFEINNEDEVPYQLEGEFLPDNITEYAFSPDNTRLFYLRPTDSGSEGVIVTLESGESERVFNSKLKEWQVSWINNNTLIFNTKASVKASGFSYTFNLSTRNLEKVVGDKDGVTTLMNPDLSRVIFSTSNLRGLDISILKRDSGQISPLSTETLPEKCVWSTKNPVVVYCAVPENSTANLPDAWYLGDVSFNDKFWRIDTETGVKNLIIDPSEFKERAVDAVDLTLTEEEDYLLFKNKKDDSVWRIAL